MTDEKTIEELETVPQNEFGISPVARKARPYLADPADITRYMKFMGFERQVLVSRIAELTSRSDQILAIYLCKQSGAYLAVANRTITTDRAKEQYFYNWLDELYAQGVPYGYRKAPRGEPGHRLSRYKWDDIEKVIEVCLEKGLDLETAAKVASVGMNAVGKYLKSGIISVDSEQEARRVGQDVLPTSAQEPDKIVAEVERERQADILEEISRATSSRGASMMAKDRLESHYGRIAAINLAPKSELAGFVQYDVEVQSVEASTGKYTPYRSIVMFEVDTPIQLIKFELAKLSEALSRIL